MDQLILKDEQISRIDTIAKVSAGKMAEALSKWIRTQIIVNSSNASIVHYSRLLEPLTSPEDIISAILVGVTGNTTGNLIFLFDENSTLSIIKKILRREIGSMLGWDHITRSVMEETGNIIGAAFLNGIATSLNLELYPSSPIVTCDYSGAILETMMAHAAMRGEYALSCQISFRSSNDEMAGIFAMLPEDISVWGRV